MSEEMDEKDVYGWIHQRGAAKISKMGPGELLITYLIRRESKADKLNTGPSNLMNILINNRLEELGFNLTDLDVMSADVVREMAAKKIKGN